ncbi:MAG: aldose epimerase family protein [Bacteroidota bacterium]|nr:aldose epimerase family protein [Bacteroidota bacterium]
MKKTFLSLLILTLFFTACKNNKNNVQLFPQSNFDTIVSGQKVSLYTLKNDKGMTAQITNYGARLVDLWVPDKNGTFKDVIWGYETIKAYLNATDLFAGPIVGRYGNRIGKGRFTLDGKSYQLTLNNHGNHLHGGVNGFYTKVWNARQFKNEKGEDALELTYISPSGEEGYPGNLTIKVVYALTANNELAINYKATTDSATIINPTSHVYFNLHGTSTQSTNSHILTLFADKYTPTDSLLIPTGEIATVENTPLDFRKPTTVGERIKADFTALKYGKGYDHNFILNKKAGEISLAAEVYEPATGIVMKVKTDQPAIQFYSGNFMDGKDTGKRGEKHNYRTGIALEAQNYPDAPNHPNFPSAVLKPGGTYTQTSVYAFEIKK